MQTIAAVRSKMQKHGLSAIYVDDRVNSLYLTGLNVSRSIIIVAQTRAWILLDSRYNLAATLLSPEWTVVFADSQKDRDQALQRELQACTDSIGFDGNSVSLRQAMHIKALASGHYEDAQDFFSMLRRPKSLAEIEKLKNSCLLCSEGFEHLLTKIKEGISEKELAQELAIFWLKKGADSLAFDSIIAFNDHSACPHWRPSEAKLKKNSVILIDIGVSLDNYQSDMTRVVFFKEVSPLLHKSARMVEEAYHLAARAALPGAAPYDIDSLVRTYFASHRVKKHFIHGLGHGVGLQIHEPPRLNPNSAHEAPLMTNDIITIEPGLYFEGHGGIRLENTCVVSSKGAISLISTPLSPIQL